MTNSSSSSSTHTAHTPASTPARDDAGDPGAPPVATWTGGQFSLVRGALGLGLAGHMLILLGEPAAGADPVVLLVGLLAALALAAGWRDHTAALALVAVWLLTLSSPGPLGASELAFGAAVVLHACTPGAPYLSWDARGRVDPGGGWRHPRNVWRGAWLALVGLYVFHAVRILWPLCQLGGDPRPLPENSMVQLSSLGSALFDAAPLLAPLACWTLLALQLLVAPLALLRRARGWIWLALLLVQLALLLLVDRPGLPVGLLALHLLAFDPAWLPARRRADQAPARVFYDGHCGLCHRTVRMLLAEDVDGAAFRFAPLQGPTFAEALPAEQRAELPDSVIVLTPDGRLLTRSDAALEALARLGGLWRALGALLGLVPRALRDLGYDGVARVRKRIFGAPEATCPLIPAELGARFLA